jgi:hypothetical protein
MKLRMVFVMGTVVMALVSSANAAHSASTKTKKVAKSAKTKTPPAATKANQLVAAGLRNFTCTGSESSRLSEYTVTGTIDQNIVMTNVTVTKNYVEQDGAAVSKPTVVMTSAKPKLTTPRESTEKFVVYQFNEIPQLASAADVGKYTYAYRINFPDTILPEPEFWAILLVQGYLGKEGSVANDQRWDDTKLVLADSVCKFVP